MKKFILISFLGLMVMAFSTSAYAQIETKVFGLIDAQWFYNVNATGANPAAGTYDANAFKFGPPIAIDLDPGPGTRIILLPNKQGGALDRKVNYYESRARLGFTATADKNLTGTILFEMDANPWGGTPDSARNNMGYWAADRAAVEIKNVYIDFGLPYIGIPLPMNFRVGLQPWAVRPALLLTTDGMGINWSTKIDPVAIQLFYAKPFEGKTAVSQDDADVLGGHVSAKLGTLSAGLYALYYNMNQFPLPGAALPYGTPANFDAEMWWYGLYMDGKLGPVNINLDGIMDSGKVMPRPSVFGPGPGTIGNPFISDVKYRGWAAHAKIDLPWDKFNFGVMGYYASGSDANDTDPLGLPGNKTNNSAVIEALTAGINPRFPTGIPNYSSKVSSYVIPPGSESGAAYGESVVFYSFYGNRGDSGIANSLNYTQMSRGPMGGTWMAKAYASAKIAPWYKIIFQGMYIGDTTKNGDTFGNALKMTWFPTGPGTFTGFAQRKDESSIGFEFDIINEIQIYKNLKLTVAGGYLFAGKAMDQFTNGGTLIPAPFGILLDNRPIKDPWALMWNLTYTF